MPTPRAGLGAALVDGQILVVGGETTDRTFNETEAFDPRLGGWTTLAPMPAGRHGVGVVAVDALYVEAGGRAPGYAFSASNLRLRP